MNTISLPAVSGAFNKQKGIATILLVVLVGLALTATSLGIIHSTKSAQQKNVAVNAATHAETGAWVATDAFRRYLLTLDSDQLLTLHGTGTFNITMKNADGTTNTQYGELTANNIQVDDPGTGKIRVSAEIMNRHATAHASSALGVVYEVETAETCPGCVILDAALEFHDDLDVAGGINIIMPSGYKPVINVDGNVEMLSVSPMSLGTINSTGSVALDSNMRVEEINSNDNVSLTGDAQALKVTTRGTVTTGGSGGAQIIWANGALTLNGTYRTDAGNTRSTVSVAPVSPTVTHGLLKADGDVTVGAQAHIEEIQTTGDVIVNGAPDADADAEFPIVDSVTAEGGLECTPAVWNDYTSISLNGVVDPGCADPLSNSNGPSPTVLKNQANTINVMAEVQEISIPPLVVDVWVLKDYANYVFEWDSTKSRTKVTVKNISGAPDGEYWIGKYADNKQDYLCKTFDGSGKCVTPAATLQTCIGYSEWNSCVSYNTGTKTWTFGGKSALPGVLWFDGNVKLDNGYNYSTVLATGNVTTGGQMRIQSVNYGGFDTICNATATADYPTGYLPGDAGSKSLYFTYFEDQYPTNLCDMGTPAYLPFDLGNIAIAAGGYNPADGGTYSGGDITLGTNNGVYGVVLAGGYFITGGQTQVFGHVSAAVQGTRGVQDNSLGGSTTLDLTHGNDNYNPNIVPDMTGGAGGGGAGGGGGAVGTTKVLWAKYL